MIIIINIESFFHGTPIKNFYKVKRSKEQMSGLSIQISINDAQINGNIRIFKIDSGGTFISPTPHMKNFCVQENSKAKMLGLLSFDTSQYKRCTRKVCWFRFKILM